MGFGLKAQAVRKGLPGRLRIRAFLHSEQYLRPAPTLYFRGLDEKAMYRVKPLDDKLVEKQESLSGASLMHHGLNLRLSGDFDSTLVILERIE